MNWAIKIISKTLMTKISHISCGVTTKGFDKGIYSNHHVILADFDSFILPKACLRGDFKYCLNPPIVTNKLISPSSWEAFDTYIVPKGKADICFATDFYFLNHAYKSITKKNCRILKNMEMFDDFSIPSWCETYNGYNPMREEYINTSFLIS